MTEKADKVLADRKDRTRKQLEKLELEARRRANPAWPYWRRAKINLERMQEIAEAAGRADVTNKLILEVNECAELADALGPQAKTETAN